MSKGARTHTCTTHTQLKIEGAHFLLKMAEGKATEDKQFATCDNPKESAAASTSIDFVL